MTARPGPPDAAELVPRDARVVWHPFTQHAVAPEPLPVVAASGPWLTLADGRRVLDAISSWWTCLHGHGHPQIVRAIADQLFAQVMTRLDGRQAELPLDSPTPLLTQEHELIRDVTEYAAFFKRSVGIAEQHTATPQADQP